MTKNRKRVEFIQRYSLFIVRAKMAGIDLMPFSFFRSATEQYQLYKKGKSQKNGTTKKSFHQSWQAMDNVIVDWGPGGKAKLVWSGRDPRWAILNQIANECGLKTGFNWTKPQDPYHVQILL